MVQLTFADLADLPPTVGKYLSSRPLPGSRAYRDEQERQAWQRWQAHVPSLLTQDGWVLEKTWHDGRWQWRMQHHYTALATMPLASLHDAIDQALWLAAFYELLPVAELWRIDAIHPEWLRALPSFWHRYQYDARRARRWQDEYQARTNNI